MSYGPPRGYQQRPNPSNPFTAPRRGPYIATASGEHDEASSSRAQLMPLGGPYRPSGEHDEPSSSRAKFGPLGGFSSAHSSTASLLPAPGPSGSQEGSRPSGSQEGSRTAEDRQRTRGHIPVAGSITNKFSLAPDPSKWGGDNAEYFDEPDDYLHNPDPRRDYKNDRGGSLFTLRGLENLGCLFIMAMSLITLFLAYPVIMYFTSTNPSKQGGFNVGGINGTGQVPQIIGNFGLIDVDTPSDAMTHPGFQDGSTYNLVWSDEFNTDGRTFYPGDDPYWEAVDLHYWQTGDLEWYDPKAVTTANGSMKIWLNKTQNHDLDYMGGMVSTWNKFCFTGGYIEVAVSIPGTNDVTGFWPAVWTMGNLGRAGYGASLDGMWPYSYDTCDVGTVANQTLNGQPTAAMTTGDPNWNNELSFLPGQRLSACTCPGESHPGPTKSDGSFTGRSAPEIDILEAQVQQVDDTTFAGFVSQSGQWAPFDPHWEFDNSTSAEFQIYDTQVSQQNSYSGGIYQEATSVVSKTAQECYTGETGCFAVYGFEYEPGPDGYITWVNNGVPAWTLYAAAMKANAETEIGQRPIPEEPMYILANLGISPQFTPVDPHLKFPAWMLIDYVRVYQKYGQTYGCDPSDHPTEAYINEYLPAYSNPNFTTWESFGQTMPKNRLVENC